MPYRHPSSLTRSQRPGLPVSYLRGNRASASPLVAPYFTDDDRAARRAEGRARVRRTPDRRKRQVRRIGTP